MLVGKLVFAVFLIAKIFLFCTVIALVASVVMGIKRGA